MLPPAKIDHEDAVGSTAANSTDANRLRIVHGFSERTLETVLRRNSATEARSRSHNVAEGCSHSMHVRWGGLGSPRVRDGRRDAIPKSNPHGRVVHRSAQSLLLAL